MENPIVGMRVNVDEQWWIGPLAQQFYLALAA